MCTLPEAQQAPRPHCGWWRFAARCFGSTMKEIISGGVSAISGADTAISAIILV